MALDPESSYLILLAIFRFLDVRMVFFRPPVPRQCGNASASDVSSFVSPGMALLVALWLQIGCRQWCECDMVTSANVVLNAEVRQPACEDRNVMFGRRSCRM